MKTIDVLKIQFSVFCFSQRYHKLFLNNFKKFSQFYLMEIFFFNVIFKNEILVVFWTIPIDIFI